MGTASCSTKLASRLLASLEDCGNVAYTGAFPIQLMCLHFPEVLFRQKKWDCHSSFLSHAPEGFKVRRNGDVRGLEVGPLCFDTPWACWCLYAPSDCNSGLRNCPLCREPRHHSEVPKPSSVLLLALPLWDEGLSGEVTAFGQEVRSQKSITCLAQLLCYN